MKILGDEASKMTVNFGFLFRGYIQKCNVRPDFAIFIK